MILTEPFRLITLHFSQIGFTDDLTFMSHPPFFLHFFEQSRRIILADAPLKVKEFYLSLQMILPLERS